MKQIPLYVDKDNTYYYVSEDGVSCDGCAAVLTFSCFIKTIWGKNSDVLVLCDKCIRKPAFKGVVMEYKFALIVDKPKLTFSPILVLKPQLRDVKDVSVFEAAEKISSPSINDKTRLSGRESFETLRIGNKDLVKELEYKDKIKNVDVDSWVSNEKNLDVVVDSNLILEDTSLSVAEPILKNIGAGDVWLPFGGVPGARFGQNCFGCGRLLNKKDHDDFRAYCFVCRMAPVDEYVVK